MPADTNRLKKKIQAAIAYDFDGTLIPNYMQDYSFFPSLGIIDPQQNFWPKVHTLAKENDMDEILAYMHLMLKEANYKNVSIHKKQFIECGNNIPFFPGVKTWFKRINAYAAGLNIELHHFIISSGLREIIDGTTIRKHFSAVYASGYLYNQDGIAIWPALAVNYTNKTQYIFRINKGISNSWDNKAVNQYISEKERPVPKENILYLGDGETDIPAMKMVDYIGGHSIAVYKKDEHKAKLACETLVRQKRAKYALPADYTAGSALDKTVKNIIISISKREAEEIL